MYSFDWDNDTGGYVLSTRTGRFVANEIRPVFAEELILTGLSKNFCFDPEEKRPYMWAQKNTYIYHGEKIAQLNSTQYGKPLDITCFFDGILTLSPVDVDRMVLKNLGIMRALIDDTKRRIKELFDSDINRCDKAYIAFSGGKDSMVLLHLCDDVLPMDVPVIFSDTDMELPDTYSIWEKVIQLFPNRSFIRAKAETSAISNWTLFGPPSRTIRWCCSVHKSTPALIELKKLVGKSSIRVMAFVGVRGEESISRSFYEDSSDGVKNASQMNRMPIIEWGAHELWLYIFQNRILINEAYRKGLPRVGCVMCPESSDKYVWFVDNAYPGLVDKYASVILKTGNKVFRNEEEKREYIALQGWQARKSGITLNETITAPIESSDGLRMKFKSSFFDEESIFTWIKPLGNVTKSSDSVGYKLQIPRMLDEGIPFSFNGSLSGGGSFEIEFRSEEERLHFIPLVRTLLRKASACVACRSCEAECIHGAISCIRGRIVIDEERCVHCKQCYENIDMGCWRFKSMYKSENEQKNQITSINRYNNFGLREKDQYLWVSTLVEMGDTFFPWNENHPLGKKMVEAASAWFQQSELISSKSRKPTKLVELFERNGGDSSIGWEFIWIALSNNSIIVKWLITHMDIDVSYSSDRIADMLRADYPELSDATIRGGLAALKDMVSKSPIGGENGFIQYEIKGKSIISMKRIAKRVHPLSLLYGMYLAARLSDSSTFTVTGLMDADINSSYIS